MREDSDLMTLGASQLPASYTPLHVTVSLLLLAGLGGRAGRSQHHLPRSTPH